jgi:hypothetical protein
MSDEIPQPPPFSEAVLADDFPTGDDLVLLMNIRNMIRDRISAMGLPEIGCGVGVGGADATFRLGERTLSVKISIEDYRA